MSVEQPKPERQLVDEDNFFHGLSKKFLQSLLGAGGAFGVVIVLAGFILQDFTSDVRGMNEELVAYRVENSKIRSTVMEQNTEFAEALLEVRERMTRIETQTEFTNLFLKEVRETERPFPAFPELQEIDFGEFALGGPADYTAVSGFPPFIEAKVPFPEEEMLQRRIAEIELLLVKELSGLRTQPYDPDKHEIETWYALTEKDGRLVYLIRSVVIEK